MKCGKAHFNPVAIEDYCFIKAEFHPSPEKKYKHVVKIAPRMAFGTGHHATTYMMIQAISKLDIKGKKVFDFGCGTGILSVVAALEGASSVIGVDIQPEAIENSVEHTIMNGVQEQCHFYLGGIEKAGNEIYDIILANINRNVIIENLSKLLQLLHPKGILLISGIMFDDVDIITKGLAKENIRIVEKRERDQWVQLTAVQNSDQIFTGYSNKALD
jgi:ribosomal protein L11 methyltransferase